MCIIFRNKRVAQLFFMLCLSAGVNAEVDVNQAGEKDLQSVKGLGPSKAKAITQERKKNGPYRSANDLHERVSGIGEKTVNRFVKNGLQIEEAERTVVQGNRKAPKNSLKKSSQNIKEKKLLN